MLTRKPSEHSWIQLVSSSCRSRGDICAQTHRLQDSILNASLQRPQTATPMLFMKFTSLRVFSAPGAPHRVASSACHCTAVTSRRTRPSSLVPPRPCSFLLVSPPAPAFLNQCFSIFGFLHSSSFAAISLRNGWPAFLLKNRPFRRLDAFKFNSAPKSVISIRGRNRPPKLAPKWMNF